MNLKDVASCAHFAEQADLADPALVHPSPGALPVLADRPGLARAVEDPSLALAERLAAGGMLALLGDPRITPSRRCAPWRPQRSVSAVYRGGRIRHPVLGAPRCAGVVDRQGEPRTHRADQ